MFLFKRKIQQPYTKENIFTFYSRLVTQARQPIFYEDLHIPDTIDGRFEMILLHVFVIIHLYKGKSESDDQFCQDLFDTFFADMDRNFREMGVGDLSVGKKVKKMAESFYGRAYAYDDALCQPEPKSTEDLAAAILKNIYSANDIHQADAQSLASYTQSQIKLFQTQPFTSLINKNPLYSLNIIEILK